MENNIENKTAISVGNLKAKILLIYKNFYRFC